MSECAVPASRLIDLTCVRPKQVWSGDRNGLNSLPLISSGRNLRSTAPRERQRKQSENRSSSGKIRVAPAAPTFAGRDQGGACRAPSLSARAWHHHTGKTTTTGTVAAPARHQADSRDPPYLWVHLGEDR